MGKNSLKNLANFFSFSDLFKYKFYFRIGKNIENSTFFSIAVSLMVLAPLIVYFVLIANNTLKHTQAAINTQEYDVNERPYLNLTSSNFRLAFSIIKSDNTFFSGNIEEYFDFVIFNNRFSKSKSTFKPLEINPFVLDTCKEENFKDFLTYYDLNLQKAFCMKHSSMNIGGYWDEPSIGWLEFQMSHCNSTQTKAKCKDRAIVEKELQESYFYVYIESQDVDSKNYEKPLKTSMKTYFQQMDFSQRKEFQFYMQKVELNTFDSLIYNTLPTTQYFNKQMSMVSDSVNAPIDNVIIRMQIFSSNKIQIIDRTYLTLIEAAAIVGGISSFVIVLGTVITFQYNDMRLKTKLINKMYSFDLNEQNDNKKEKKIKKISKTNLFSPTKKSSGFNQIFKNKNIDVEKLKEKLNQYSEPYSEPQIIIPNDFIKINNINFDNKIKTNKLNESKSEPDEIVSKTKTPPKKTLLKKINHNNNEKKNDKEQIDIELSSVRSPGKNILIEEKNNFIAKEINLSEIVSPSSLPANKKETTENSQVKLSKLIFSSLEIIMCIFIPFCLPTKVKKKYNLYQKASGYLMKYINIFYLVKMLEDVEKLKSVLLNNHQITLFNYISKPNISLRTEETMEKTNNYMSVLEKILDLSKDKNNRDMVSEIRSYYKELKNKGNCNLIDVRLFDYLDEKFKENLKIE